MATTVITNKEIDNSNSSSIVKDNSHHDNNNNLNVNSDNKINNKNVNENFINQGPIDQAILNSLLNTSKLTAAEPLAQTQVLPSSANINKDTSSISFNQFNTLNQLLNTGTNPSPQAIQAQVLAQAILAQQQQQNNINNQKIENNDPKKGAVSLNHPDADKWLYLDPQNQIQGTFNSEEMAAWFAAGYFTLNLMIKRGCDDQFLPLGIRERFYFSGF